MDRRSFLKLIPILGILPSACKSEIMITEAINVKSFGAIGDGMADDTNPINAALSVGGVIYIPPGTYNITSSLFPRSDTRLFGDGDNSVLRLNANSNVINISGQSNISIRDIKINGQSNIYTSSGNNGIFVDWTSISGQNVEIDSIKIENIAGAGIIALASQNTISSGLYITNSKVSGTGAHGIISQDYISNVIVRGNHVSNFGLMVSNRPGITASRDGSNVVVSDNVVIASSSAPGTSVHGISIDGTKNATCLGNSVSGCTHGYGIEVGFVDTGSFAVNSIDGCKGGILVSGSEAINKRNLDVTISANSVKNMTGYGIYSFITSGTGQLLHENISISNNTVSSCDIGIFADFINVGAINGNICTNNNKSGIYVLDCLDMIIDGNNSIYNNTESNPGHDNIRVLYSVLPTSTSYLLGNNYTG